MHGPKPQSHVIELNKVRRLGLKIALSARPAEGKVCLSVSASFIFADAHFFFFSLCWERYNFHP